MALKWADFPRPIVCLAPMDGITDSAYRRLVRRFNQSVVLFSEFTSADGLLRSEKLRARLKFQEEEHPYFVQLFGNNPEAFAQASRLLEDQGVAGIDINMGCPARKIVSSRHGSGLMQDVNQACRIVEAVAEACGLEVSVKTRLGWQNAEHLQPFARRLEGAGASLITIHGRTYSQGFNGEARWEPIFALKKALSVPLLGNGDVRHIAHGRERMGNLDGFMIGRAAIGNPWAFLPGAEQGPPPLGERVRVIRDHYELIRESTSARQALLEFRKHLVGYLRGIDHIRPLRGALMTAPDEAGFFHLLGQLEERAAPLALAG